MRSCRRRSYGIDPEEAFGLLRTTSNDRNVRLHDVARVVVQAATNAGDRRREYIDAVVSRPVA